MDKGIGRDKSKSRAKGSVPHKMYCTHVATKKSGNTLSTAGKLSPPLLQILPCACSIAFHRGI